MSILPLGPSDTKRRQNRAEASYRIIFNAVEDGAGPFIRPHTDYSASDSHINFTVRHPGPLELEDSVPISSGVPGTRKTQLGPMGVGQMQTLGDIPALLLDAMARPRRRSCAAARACGLRQGTLLPPPVFSENNYVAERAPGGPNWGHACKSAGAPRGNRNAALSPEVAALRRKVNDVIRRVRAAMVAARAELATRLALALPPATVVLVTVIRNGVVVREYARRWRRRAASQAQNLSFEAAKIPLCEAPPPAITALVPAGIDGGPEIHPGTNDGECGGDRRPVGRRG